MSENVFRTCEMYRYKVRYTVSLDYVIPAARLSFTRSSKVASLTRLTQRDIFKKLCCDAHEFAGTLAHLWFLLRYHTIYHRYLDAMGKPQELHAKCLHGGTRAAKLAVAQLHEAEKATRAFLEAAGSYCVEASATGLPSDAQTQLAEEGHRRAESAWNRFERMCATYKRNVHREIGNEEEHEAFKVWFKETEELWLDQWDQRGWASL